MEEERKVLNINKTPLKDLWVLLGEMSRETWFFEAGWRCLGRHFFSYFYGKEVYQWDYGKLLSVCSGDSWPHVDEKLSEEEFVMATFRNFFWIATLPRDSKQKLLSRIQALIRVLYERLNRYRQERDDLSKLDSRTEQQEYELRLLRHYVRKVQEALEGVCGFAAHDLNVEALLMSQQNFPGFIGFRRIDIVEMKASVANKLMCNDIVNKFSDWPILKVDELRIMYENDCDRFFDFTEKLLSDNIIPSTLSLVETHHLLSARREMLKEGITMYKDKKYPVANSVLALQVEGLIRDALVSSGFPEKKLTASSLTEKAELLDKQNVNFNDYEYYAFRYPVLRNRIAHGDAHKTQREDAIMVLLDVCSLCRFIANDDTLPCNKLVSLTKRFLAPEATGGDKVAYARFVVANEGIRVPDFYGLQKIEEGILKEIQGEGFWRALLNQEKYDCYDVERAIKEGAGIAKRFDANSRFDAFKQECKKILRQTHGE